MAPSPIPKGILEIGKALIKELNIEPGDDTLCRWMAHYIAELIADAETSTAEDRPGKLTKCADAVLAIWKHRHELPNGKRPFEELEPIIRAMESLDPTNDTPRYFRTTRRTIDISKENTDVKEWLELADGLDYSAKILISYCLMQASQGALDSSKEWVKLAKTAVVEDEIEFTVVRFVSSENQLLKAEEADERERKLLDDRINRLDEFIKIAGALLAEMREITIRPKNSK